MGKLPLEGIRIADFTQVVQGPYATMLMGQMGAEVIKVDTCDTRFMDTTRILNGPYPDNDPGELYWERGGTFQTLNRGKRSLTLDLRSEAAIEVLKRLVRLSDVVMENFTPRVMGRFGLDYANLKAVKPDLIMVSNTGYGHSGPWSNFGAMASALEPTHGTGAFMGYLTDDGKGSQPRADVPNKVGNSYSDFLASLTAELAVLASLMHRSRTGKGMWIDLAMYQVGVSFVGEGVLDYAFNERRTRRMGNRHESMAPHGCYPCVGDDEWVAIAVRNDSDWAAMCQAMESPSLAVDTRFAHAKSRLQRQEKLDAIVSEWTATQDQYQVMDRLQGVGVPAGPVLNARGLLTDPHIRERRLFEPADHPEVTGLGRREYLGRGWKLSGSEVKVRGPAPILGEGNEYVLGEVMGLGADEIQALRDEGAIGEHPIGATTPGAVSLERQVELGWTVSYDPEFRQILGGAG
jgi:crotonobetainyl-CoA:carnitine CoA-transferase CaiB-like acyl-CoA transferase